MIFTRMLQGNRNEIRKINYNRGPRKPSKLSIFQMERIKKCMMTVICLCESHVILAIR